MTSTDQVDNIYWAPVDPDAPNNSHAFSLELIGKNRRVLELGPAAGHFTKALVDNGCRVVGVEVDPAAAEVASGFAERVVIGDLSDPDVVTSAIDEERFDVVVGGDVLEHLPDPLRVLRACRPALKPGGYVVLSLPNIAHADVKLQLLAGRFPYRDTGLLDRTHLHFFTRESIEEMLRDAGLLLIDLKRVTLPVFTTEQAVDPTDVPPDLLAAVLADPESETYQFVVRAIVHDGDAEVANLASRAVALQTELERERARRVLADSELEEARADLATMREALDEAVAHAQGFEALAKEHEAHIEALRSTRSYKMMAPLRAIFGRRG
jgi:2-polyprenyl-3-methyl-5-hydroxy-6-metoxy-1,4-benzoquinol methylase